MNKINLIGYGIVTLVVGLIIGALIGFSSHLSPVLTTGAIPALNAPVANTTLPNGIQTPNPSNYDYLVARLYFYVDGALGFGNGTAVVTNEQAVRSTLSAATTTPCNLQNPFTATSSINTYVNVTTGTSTTESFVFGTSTTPNATTSPSASVTIALNATPTFASGVIFVGPKSWVVGGFTATSSLLSDGRFTLGGSCQGTFRTVN